MVSAGVSYAGKGRLHFVDEKVKINAEYYTTDLLPKLIEDCESLLLSPFSNKMAHLLIQHVRSKNGCHSTALISSTKTNGLPIHLI